MKKLTTYFLSTGCIIAAAFGMSALASATVNVSPAFETVTNSEGEELDKTEYKDFDELQAALSKAKPTGELTIILNDAQSPKKSVKIPKTLDKVTLTGTGTLNITKAKSMSIDCPADINLTIDGGGKAKLATKGDVDIQTSGNINNVTALSGAKSATLKVSDNEDFNFAVSGFGTVQVDNAKTADFIGGEKGDALKVGKLELAGTGVANVYSHPVTVDSLVAPNTSSINFVTTGTENKKVAHSYITVKKEAAEANVKIDAGTKYGDAATITSVAFEPSNKVLVIKAKDFETLGISLKSPMVPASTGTKYALSNKKGTYTVKPASYTLSGTDYTTWEEVANYITDNGSSDTPYTVTINYDTREEGAIKFPKKDTYKSLTIQGKDQDTNKGGIQLPTWAFTGGVSTSGDVVIKNVLLKSYKFDKKGNKDVAQQFALNGGKYSLTLDNVGTFTENDKPTYLKSVSADELILENNDSAGSGFTLYSLSLKANVLRLGNSSKTGETDATGSIAISTAAASFKNGITNLLGSNGAEVTTRAGDKIAFTFVDKKTLNAATKDINKLKVTAPAYGNQFVILNGGTAAAPKYTFAYSGKNLMPTDLSSETAFGLIKTTTGADIIMGKDVAANSTGTAFSAQSTPSYVLTDGAKAQKIYFKTFKDIASYIETASKNDENAANNYYGIVIEKDEKNVDVKLPKADTYKGIVLLSGKETSDSKRDKVTLTPKSKITLTGAFYVVEDVDLKIDAKNVVNKVEADYVNKPLLKKTVIDSMNAVEKTYKEYVTAYTAATTNVTAANLKTLKTKADANKAAVEAAKTAIENLTFTLDSAEKIVLLKANEVVADDLATWTEAATGSKEIKYISGSSSNTLADKYVVLKNVGNGAVPAARVANGPNAVSTYEFSDNETAKTITGGSGTTAQGTAVIANVKAKIDGSNETTDVLKDGIKVIVPTSSTGLTVTASAAGKVSITTQAEAAEKDHEVTVFVPDGNSYTLTIKVVKGATN